MIASPFSPDKLCTADCCKMLAKLVCTLCAVLHEDGYTMRRTPLRSGHIGPICRAKNFRHLPLALGSLGV